MSLMSAVPFFSEPSRVDEIMNNVGEIAVLPHVVYKVLELSGSDDTSAVEIERAIVVDPGFSARVLSLANSAYLALPKKVSSIKDAIMFCGIRHVRELAMTVGVYDMFVGKSDRDSMRRRGWWRHSLDTAVCAKWIAGKGHLVPIDEAYTCGLLHLIGKTLLCRFGGEDYEQVENLVGAGYTEIQAEKEVYGADHSDIALRAALKWGFPQALSAGMNYLAPPRGDEEFIAHRATVAIGNKIAKYVIEGRQTREDGTDELELQAWALEILKFSPDNNDELVAGAIQAIASAQGFAA